MYRLAFALLIFSFSLQSFSQSTNRLDTAKYFDFVEEMPEYKGDVNTKQLAPDIMGKMKRPCTIGADSNKILIHFIVETDGTVQKAIIVKGICEEMNKQAIEELRKLKFTPGKQSGQKVRVKEAVMLKFTS